MVDIFHSEASRRITNWVLIAFAALVVINAVALHYIAEILIPLGKALILGIICIIYGRLILFFFKQKQIPLETAFSTGLIATTFYFFILGFLHQLSASWFYVYIILAAPAGIFFFYKILVKRERRPQPNGSAAPAAEAPDGTSAGALNGAPAFHVIFPGKLSLEYLVFLFPLFYAALPASFFDTLVYHLGIPNLYIQQGGFCATPHFVYANTSIYYEIAMIPAVFAGKLVPNFFHLFVGVVLVFAALRFARDFININKSTLLIILIISLPMSGFLLTTVKNDLAGALFILVGIRLLLEQRFVAAGISWGFAVGIKYFNILPMAIFLVLFTIYRKKFPVMRYFYFSLTFLAALVPLFLKNILYTGNPVFPFLYSLFPSAYWDESRSLMMARDVGRVCRTWKDFLYLPYNLSFKELGSGGRVGVQFLVFLPFMILLRRRGTARGACTLSGVGSTRRVHPLKESETETPPSEGSAPPAAGGIKSTVLAAPGIGVSRAAIDDAGKTKNLLLIFALLTISIGCGFTASIRFLYLPFLILCMFVVWIYEQRPKGLMKFLMFVILVLNSAASISMLNLLYNPQLLYTQNIDQDEYIDLTFPAYPAFQFLERHTPRNSMILVVGETRNYYLKRPYKVSSAIDYSILKPYLEKANNLDEWLAELRADGIDYLLVNFPEFYRLNSQYDRLSAAMQQKALSFFNQMEPIFQTKSVYIYRIKK